MPDQPAPPTFAGLPARTLETLHGARVAILGIAEASPYQAGQRSHAAGAPQAIRAASREFGLRLQQIDFDLAGPEGEGRQLLRSDADAGWIADLGDLPVDAQDAESNRTRITGAVRAVLEAGAVPVVLGGDDSVPIPVFRAYDGHGPLTIVQIDAHVDWGDVIQGNPFGYGSTMRRASEMPWIAGMVQVGIRGLGSGMPDQIETARAWGSRLVSAREVRRHGVERVLELIPPGTDTLLTIDCDGLDPSVLPAVNMPTPGGLDYGELAELIRGVAARGRIRGCNLVELVPARDRDGLSSELAVRIVLSAIGGILGSG